MNLRTAVQLGFIALLGLCASSANAAAGRTPGGLAVSDTGAATYAIPIHSPPGVRGLEPSLSLSYSSSGGSAWLGAGWNVSGLSVIARCKRTIAQDGLSATIVLGTNDRFCLDGARLRLVTGTHGGNGAEYRTEIESFSRVKSFGVAGDGPAYFVVEQKNGLIYEYGNTTDSRIESLGLATARAWAVNKIRDRHGNAITFEYEEDATNGAYRIVRVRYNTNSNLGITTAPYLIEFSYAVQPSQEIEIEYLGGRRIEDIKRMTQVNVSYNGGLIRRYVIAYESALSNTNRSRILSIQECAGSTGADCLSPTTFAYQNGTIGIAAEVSSGISPTNPMPLDTNGDGRTDLVYSSSATSGSGVWMVMHSTGTGYSAPINTGITNTNFSQAIPIDYNADGLEDFLVPGSGGTWMVVLGTASGLAAPTNTSVPVIGAGGNARALDANGDGLDDLVYAITTGASQSVQARYRNLSGTFDAPVTLYGPVSYPISIVGPVFGASQFASKRRNPDFNGDGIADFVVHTFDSEPQIPNPHSWEAVLNGGNGVSYLGNFTVAGGPYWPDLNGDGCSDAVYTANSYWRYRFSTCYSLGVENVGPLIQGMVQTNSVVYDWDGDGYDDIVGRNQTTITWNYMRSNGQTLSSIVNTGIAATVSSTMVGDANGDGLDDLLYRNASNIWAHRLHAGVMPDLLQTVTDGYGLTSTISYAPLSSGPYARYTGAVFPVRDYQGSMHVVSNVVSSNGIGGSYTLGYYYEGARLDLQGRGFLGFAYRQVNDSRDNTALRYSYSQSFPTIGAVVNAKRTQPAGTEMEGTVTTYLHHTYSSGNETRFFPYVSQSVTRRYEVGGTYNGALLSTATTTNTVDAPTGVTYDSTTTVSEPAAGANGDSPSATWTARTYAPLANFANDFTNWCFGLPGRVQQINSHSQTYGTSTTRTSAATWNTTFCRPSQQVTEPDSTTLRVAVDIAYDNDPGETQADFGNPVRQTVIGRNPDGSNMAPRVTSTQWDATGRFPTSATNALGQSAQAAWNLDRGTRQSATDPNGVSVSWTYDNFDRVTQETRPDGTRTTRAYTDCASAGGCVNANNRLIVGETTVDSTNTAVTDGFAYLDRFDRVIVTASKTLGGVYNRQDREFDALGRVYRTSAPCTWSSCTYFWTTNSYDLAGRATLVQRPVSDSDATLQSSQILYEGLRTRTVDALSKQTLSVTNAIGQMVRSQDHDGYAQIFQFDAFGNAMRISDTSGNTLQTAQFNLLGARTQSADMDMGTWTYTPNSLGEIVSQTDAKSQTVSLVYDLLGRLTTRTEPEGTSNWEWGTSSALKEIGQLKSVSGLGYSEAYTFDSIGRPQTTKVTSDATYQIDYAYNGLGLLDSLTYPTSTSGYRLKLKYDYEFGKLKRVKDFNAPTTVFWTVNSVNARDQVTQEALGNGLVTNRSFDAVTAWIKSIQTGVSGGTGVQNLAYKWDRSGNLTERKDVNQSLTENFYYDNLYRLDYSQLNSVTNLDLGYDALGNITSKSDVGTYTYHATKKHAVASTSNGWSFTYDANGNMQTGRGQTITWTSFNYPSLISQGTAGGPVTQNVSWTNLVLATTGASGSIQKSGGAGDASGLSSQQLTGDGSLEFKVNNNGTNPTINAMYACLDSGTQTSGVASTWDYCLVPGAGYMAVYQQGVWKADIIMSVTDLFKIAVESNIVKYYKNGALFYTSALAPSFPLKGYFTTGTTGYGLTQASITYNAAGSSVSSQFFYGPHRNYWKQIGTYSNGTSTTIYVGGLLEKVTNAGVDDYRHYIRAGGATITVSRASNGVNNTYYTTQDHLGSSSAVTNASGTVLMQSSFGAFGARRGSNWQGSPSSGDWTTIASTSRRGFTDHTMLDNLSLIHMNGRVMDPLLGRFISADPHIDCAINTQGWNRFSYTKNNPLSKTDPTGFLAKVGGGTLSVIMPEDPFFEYLMEWNVATSQAGHIAARRAPNPFAITPLPTGARSEALLEVQVTARQVDRPLPQAVRVDFLSPTVPQFKISARDRSLIDSAAESWDNCFSNCMQFWINGIVAPIASVAGGFADGGSVGALAGAGQAYLDSVTDGSPLGRMTSGYLDGIGSGLRDRRATASSTARRGNAGLVGGVVGSGVESGLEYFGANEYAAGAIGDLAANYTNSYLRADWNNLGSARSNAAGLRGLQGGLRGTATELLTAGAGFWAASSYCDNKCSR